MSKIYFLFYFFDVQITLQKLGSAVHLTQRGSAQIWKEKEKRVIKAYKPASHII